MYTVEKNGLRSGSARLHTILIN